MTTPEWELDRLHQPPRTWPAPGFDAPGVRGMFFEGETHAGKPTRVFAWMGMPHLPEGATCPAMVLLHGGGGTAFAEWVRIWNRRGYAAITFDQCGCTPEPSGGIEGQPPQRHEMGGPTGWQSSFDQVNEPIADQWPHHAVAAALKAHSLLAAQPGVDPGRIGVTGISWGGYLTGLVAGVDARLKCAIPVYGCGYLGHNSAWKESGFNGRPEADVQRWLSQWDPSVYLPRANLPVAWVSGTNDFAYPMDSLRKSCDTAPDTRALCLRIAMQHSHVHGWAPQEIGVFADSILRGAAPLPVVGKAAADGNVLRASLESARPVKHAELCFTRATGFWPDRRYNALPARIVDDGTTVEAEVPPRTTVAFLNVTDDRDCVSSSRHIEIDEQAGPSPNLS